MKKYLLWLILTLSIILLAGCAGKTEQTEKIGQSQAAPLKTAEQTVNKPADQAAPGSAAAKSAAKSISWYFVPNKEHTAPGINQAAVDMMTQNKAIYLLPNDSKKVYLTFDCGYELGYTTKILDILQRQQVKAAFFITGDYLQSKPELVRRMKQEGHLVCNHTLNHPDLSTISQEKLSQEITLLAQRYQELTGMAMDKYCRPPMGNFSQNSLQWTHELGYTTVFWSMAWQDWDPQKQPGAAFVRQYVMDHIHPGAIILMHAVSSSDTEALENVIIDSQAQGYVFSTFE